MTELALSSDQQAAEARLHDLLRAAGVDLAAGSLAPPGAGGAQVLAITGKAGSGKTLLLARLARALAEAGVETVTPDHEPRRRRNARSLAILAPTNKAASVLRRRGVPATTIHRILYAPVWDPAYERVAEWLTEGARPEARPAFEALTPEALDRAAASFGVHGSVFAALAAAGLRGSDFIRGWTRRAEPLDIGFVDEASMLDARQLDDLREIFSTLVLFGDPAQLAPVNAAGGLCFDALPRTQVLHLARVHRQAADNPILDLAHALADPALGFDDFEQMITEAARRDGRVVLSGSVSADLMARSPVLVWRNATRIRLIGAFRAAHGAPDDALVPGEPLICDGIDLPLKHRKKRLDLEARGLIKGAQVVYLGPGRRAGFARLHVLGAEDPQVSAASIIRIELPGEGEPMLPDPAQMGAVFLHGAAVTIHKAQGSQWEEVQVFAPDIAAAADAGRSEAGQPLWKRLAYVAITRAEERLHWVTRYRLARPSGPLPLDDLARIAPTALTLHPEPET